MVVPLAYRTTAFARDKREVSGRGYSIRGKCPLELADCELSNTTSQGFFAIRALFCQANLIRILSQRANAADPMLVAKPYKR